MYTSLLAHALSGGVDSSVAAYLLQAKLNQDQHDRGMVGVHHYIWPGSICCSEEVRERARRLCDRLRIDFHVVDMVEEFREQVVEDFVRTYIAGETPNPCVKCNETIRFSSFYRRLQNKFVEEGILDPEGTLYFSTGHYARIEKTEDGLFIKQAVDETKDQSYMLYRLRKEHLSRSLFPLAD